MFNRFTRDLSDITGFHTVSLQPNAGSQGEYTGLRVILAYLQVSITDELCHSSICRASDKDTEKCVLFQNPLTEQTLLVQLCAA